MTMNTRSDGTGLQKGLPSRTSFSVVAVYEGYQAEDDVNQSFAWLHQALRADLKLTFSSWCFDKLASAPDVRCLSLRIASEADLIIVAASGAARVPDHVGRWLDSILQQQQRGDRAILIALESHDQAASAVPGALEEFVHQEADRWQAGFLSCPDLGQSAARQHILRLINDRFTDAPMLPDAPPPNATTGESEKQHIMHQTQAALSPSRVREIRDAAYHLWLQAGGPAGQEVDFWLQAERQINQTFAANLGTGIPREPNTPVTST